MAEAASLEIVAVVDSESDPMQKVLSKDDLPALLTILSEAAHKWELIATFLEIDETIIKSIQYSSDPQVNIKLLEVIRRWLKTIKPATTVKSLVDALKNPVVGEDKLALEILEKFSPHSTHIALQKSMSSDARDQIVPPHTEKIDRSESSPAAMSSESTVPECIPKIPDIEVPTAVHVDPSCQPNPVNVGEPDFEHPSSYKFLDLDKMSELERRTLMGQLTNDYKRITASYSKLNQYVIQSLKDRSITPKQLTGVLMHLGAFLVQKMNDSETVSLLAGPILDKIREADDVDDVFYFLYPYGSFFDCHIIRHIVDSNLCTDDDREELKKYEKELATYCQRSVFECPHIKNKDPKFQSFVMKVDDSVLKSSDTKAIDAFRVEVAHACGLKGHTLCLCTVEKGCLQLTFQIPPFVAESVFPLTFKQKFALKGLGVLKLTCEPSWEYELQHMELPCAWRRLFGRCNYGKECRNDHTVDPIQDTPAVGNLPDFATVSAANKIPSSGHTPEGKSYAIVFRDEKMKIVAEDTATLKFAQAETRNQLQQLREDARLKYSYIHPDGITQPVLYAFKKPENAKTFQLEQITPKESVKQMTIADFEHLPNKHVTSAYSRLSRHKRVVYPIQLRADYEEDILEQLKQSLCWMHENHLTPQIEGRFGKFTWRECLDDECFDVEKLITLSKESNVPPGLSYYTFNTEVANDDATTMKASLQQVGHLEKTYTLILIDADGEEAYRVKLKFDDKQNPCIVYTRKLVCWGNSSVSKVQVLLDILFLHRNHDTRISLCDFETVEENPSVVQFITSTIEVPEPGVFRYNPALSQEKWFLSYIRYQESETFKLQDSYTVEISTVGEYRIKQPADSELTIMPEDFHRRSELELHCNSLALNPVLLPHDLVRDQASLWTPNGIIATLKKTGFLQVMEDLNAKLDGLHDH